MTITAFNHENDAMIKKFCFDITRTECMLQLSTVHLFQGQEQPLMESGTMEMSSAATKTSSASEQCSDRGAKSGL